MLFLAHFGNFDTVFSGKEFVCGSNQGVRGLHNDWSEEFPAGSGGCKNKFLAEPICLNSVDQAKFTHSYTVSQIQLKSLPFVRICHIDSPIHISRDVVG